MSNKNTLTNKEYLINLSSLGIKVFPLEKYITSKKRILHRCTCGNAWLVKPRGVLKGNTCGHDRVKNNEEYLASLKDNSIKVIPLERYINMKTKISHKCVCGNEWEVTPRGVLSGNKCGCRRSYSLRGEAYYKDKETVLYYIKIDNLYKIGVTLFKTDIESSLKKRFSKRFKDIEILQTEIFKDGSEAFRLEQSIINENWNVRYNGDKILDSGNTELFIEDIR